MLPPLRKLFFDHIDDILPFFSSEEVQNLSFRKEFEKDDENVLLGTDQTLHDAFKTNAFLQGRDHPFVRVEEKLVSYFMINVYKYTKKC
jgi:hypothetical protein